MAELRLHAVRRSPNNQSVIVTDYSSWHFIKNHGYVTLNPILFKGMGSSMEEPQRQSCLDVELITRDSCVMGSVTSVTACLRQLSSDNEMLILCDQ
jgi:hypothetical protein